MISTTITTRTSVLGIAAGALTLAGSLLGAPPAHAADESLTVATCAGWPEGQSYGPVTITVGSTFTVTFTDSSNCALYRVPSGMTYGSVAATLAPNDTITSVRFTGTATGGGASTAGFDVRNSQGWWAPFYIIVTAADGAEPPAPEVVEEEAGPPNAWLRMIVRPDKDGACPDGWGPSWAQWPNGGAGGYVCVQTIPAYGLPTPD